MRRVPLGKRWTRAYERTQQWPQQPACFHTSDSSPRIGHQNDKFKFVFRTPLLSSCSACSRLDEVHICLRSAILVVPGPFRTTSQKVLECCAEKEAKDRDDCRKHSCVDFHWQPPRRAHVPSLSMVAPPEG